MRDLVWSLRWFEFIKNNITDEKQWHTISSNRNLNIEIVKKYPDYPWKMCCLSLNPNVTIDVVKSNPDINWNMSAFSHNINVTPEIVINNPDIDWDVKQFNRNKNFTVETLEKYPEWNLDIKKVNWSNITLEQFKKYKHIFNDKNIAFCKLFTYHKDINIQTVIENKKLKWRINELSSHPSITFNDILENINIIKWNFDYVSRNPNVDYNIIQEYPFFNWSIRGFRYNKNIDIQTINDHMKKYGKRFSNAVSTIGVNGLEKPIDINNKIIKRTKWSNVRNISIDDFKYLLNCGLVEKEYCIGYNFDKDYKKYLVERVNPF